MNIALRYSSAALSTLFLLTACFGQSPHSGASSRRTASGHTGTSKIQLKLVAGIVEQDGTVRYLPRVAVRIFPQKYADAEKAATSSYNTEVEQLRQIRDSKYKGITDRRRAELQSAQERYNEQLHSILGHFSFDPAQAMPTCAEFDSILQRTDLCSQYGIGKRIALSTQLRSWIASSSLIGAFDPQTFKIENTPYAHDRVAALSSIPLRDYETVPEFQRQIQKAVQKERSKAHLSSSTTLPDELQRVAVSRFITDWTTAAAKQSYFGSSELEKFGFLTLDFISSAHKQLEISAQIALRKSTDKPLLAFMNDKDQINAKYDSEQANADSEFQSSMKAAEDRRAAALEAAAKAHPALSTGSTSLEGDAVLGLIPGSYALYAEDTTTDHHYRWAVPVVVRSMPSTIELTDANALKATADTPASAAGQPVFPKASELSATQKAEYDLRYGSRLLGSWKSICSVHGKQSQADERLILNDSPLGFGFAVTCTSNDVFNTLRMNENDIAARTFRDYVAPYLGMLPADLKSTGGSQAFESVSVNILTSSKSFADEYAVGNFFWLDYTFQLGDVESFASQKIDAQQLLDRGHITNDRIGRITVKLVGAN